MSNQFIRPRKGPFKKQREHSINEEITFPQVRVTGEGIESCVVSTIEALKMAQDLGVDLVLISPLATPPVCKIIEYSKLLYEKKLKDKENKKKQDNAEVKELRFTPTTDEHDLNFKTKNATQWLKDGHKVKAVVVFKGRMIQHKSSGEVLLLKLSQALQEYCRVDQLPKLEGFKMIMLLSPKKK